MKVTSIVMAFDTYSKYGENFEQWNVVRVSPMFVNLLQAEPVNGQAGAQFAYMDNEGGLSALTFEEFCVYDKFFHPHN